jgi:hypothetical protein
MLTGQHLQINECKGCFVQGQPVSESMTQQLKELGIIVDDTSQYKTDE